MNNSAFRGLLSDKQSTKTTSDHNGANDTFKKPAATALGSRMRSSIPMTPRSIPGHRQNAHSEFARQVAAATNNDSEGPTLKKFKTSAAPKGTKLASGYTDRASLRNTGSEGKTDVENKEKRLKALEEMYKLQQIDEATFSRLKDEIGVGGDVGSTHLVRGLDWKLLARVKRGEDVTKETENAAADEEEKEREEEGIDVDAEFDKELEKEVVARTNRDDRPHEDESNEPEQIVDTRSMSRDEILRRLKEGRRNPPSSSTMTPPQAPVLNDRFKKVATTPKGPKKEKFTETVNGRRREVLLITNTDGTTKRKTRWLDPEAPPEEKLPVEVQDSSEQGVREKKKARKPVQDVMGMEVPAEIAAREAARQAAEAAAAAEEEDDDIFQGVGDDYDPLADIKSDDSEDEEKEKPADSLGSDSKDNRTKAEEDQETKPSKKRNYFSTTATEQDDQSSSNPSTKDPSILAALKRASEIRKREEQQERDSNSQNQTESTDKSAAFLARLRESERQDAADLDMGFGGSRFDDEEDDNGTGEGLLDFNAGMNDDADGEEQDGGKKAKGNGGGRKRGEKKKKGDKNSFKDVMGAIERKKVG